MTAVSGFIVRLHLPGEGIIKTNALVLKQLANVFATILVLNGAFFFFPSRRSSAKVAKFPIEFCGLTQHCLL